MKKTLFILEAIQFQLNCFSQPAIQWQKTLGGSFDDYGYNIQQNVDVGYIVAGMTNSTDGNLLGNHGDYDYWIVKLEVGALSTSSFQKEQIVIYLIQLNQHSTCKFMTIF